MSDTPSTPAGTPSTEPSAFKAGLPPPPPVSEPSGYRPISGFAIAGFAGACLFALMVLVVAAVALVKGEPFFYPVWVLLLPAAALVVSVVARSQIRGAEGTRAGDGLARAGIWISLFTGLGYFVYHQTTGWAVESQANDYLMVIHEGSGFFPHLAKGSKSTTDLYAAFLLALPPTQRGPVRPEDHAGILRLHEVASDGGPGLLAKFRDQLLVQFVTAAAPEDVHIEPLGVQSWEYENRSYKVRRVYRVATPEAQVDFSIIAMSAEGETAGEPRQWYLPLNQIPRPSERHVKLTRLGEGLRVVRHSARMGLGRWYQKVNEGEPFAFEQKDRTNWEKLPMPPQQRARLQARLQDLFHAKEPARLAQMQFPPDEPQALGGWQKTADGKIQIPFAVRIRLGPHNADPPYMVDARIVVESKAPIDPATLPYAPADFDWEIHSIEMLRAAPPPAAGDKGGPPVNPKL